MTMKAELLRTAVGQPAVVDGDPVASARAHAELIRSARADVIVFPELSLTGYYLDAPDVELDMAMGPGSPIGKRICTVTRTIGSYSGLVRRRSRSMGGVSVWASARTPVQPSTFTRPQPSTSICTRAGWCTTDGSWRNSNGAPPISVPRAEPM